METTAIKTGVSRELSFHTHVRERFWSRVDKSPECGCWNWTRGTNGLGYGRLMADGRFIYAHRYSYENIVGKIPDGLALDHLCQNKLCVNPAHLEVVTIGENVRRYFRSLTKCKWGHAWTEQNTRTNEKGHRYCRECNRIAMKKRREKKTQIIEQSIALAALPETEKKP